MISTFLDNLKDHRRAQGLRYELKHIILFSIMAILSNAKSYRQISSFIKVHYKTLDKDFCLNWKSPPSYSTVRNIIQGTDHDGLEYCFRSYSQSLSKQGNSNTETSIAVDGKVLRGSYDHFEDKKAVQVLSFFETRQRLILAHEVIEEKTNEIPVFQRLINEFQLEGIVYTLDALHCQKKTFGIAGENDKKLIIQLKDNQKGLLQNCNDIIRFCPANGTYENTGEKNRNRIEDRTVKVFYKQSGFIEDKFWAETIKTVILVERKSQIYSTKEKQYKTRQEQALYLSNYKVNAKNAYQHIRNHWFIENTDHHVRDVTLREDYSRIRIKPENMSLLRSFALNILRRNKINNINDELYQNSLQYYNQYCYQQFI
jgi:predicted transposase YbfD/YdcC